MNGKRDLFSPEVLDEFVGKPEKVKILKKNIAFAKQQGAPLGHILITGPSGVGKSILFELIAREAKVNPAHIRRVTGADMKDARSLLTLLLESEEESSIFREMNKQLTNYWVRWMD